MAIFTLQNNTAPSTPSSNQIAIYADSGDNDRVKFKDDAGNVRLLETEWGAVPTHIIFAADNTYDIGDASHAVRTIYIDTSIVLGAAASKIVPGATSFAIRNNADNANNLIITDAGAATVRTSLAVTTTLTVSGNTALAGSENTFGATGVASGVMRPIMVSQSTGSIVRLHTTLSGNGHSTSVEEAGIQFTTDDTDWSAGSIYGSIVMLSENVFGAAYSLLFKNSSQSDGGNDEQMRLTSAGRLGIGITAPLGKLHVYDTDSGAFFWRGTGIDSSTGVTVLSGVTQGVTLQFVGKVSGIEFGGTAFVGLGEYNNTAAVGKADFEVTAGGAFKVFATSANVEIAIWVVYR